MPFCILNYVACDRVKLKCPLSRDTVMWLFFSPGSELFLWQTLAWILRFLLEVWDGVFMFHSNMSSFNQRQPKAGPSVLPPPHFQQDNSHPKPTAYTKRSYSGTKVDTFLNRKIATNSRIEKDEKYKKDMHLAYVNNALLQKTKVRCPNAVICWPSTFLFNRETILLLTSLFNYFPPVNLQIPKS